MLLAAIQQKPFLGQELLTQVVVAGLPWMTRDVNRGRGQLRGQALGRAFLPRRFAAVLQD